MSVASRFAAAVCEEVWIAGRLAERRLSWGEAHEEQGVIVATDRGDAQWQWLADVERAVQSARALVLPACRMRFVAEKRDDGEQLTIVVGDGVRSVVTDTQHFVDDVALLTAAGREAEPVQIDPARFPLVWRNGSGAVLLHEAVGHPDEHGRARTDLPAWLTVDVPLVMRRATFRDVPLRRMAAVRAQQVDAPFALPDERLEIELVDGGMWDPLTDEVTVRIAAALVVQAGRARPVAPFTLVASRKSILRSVRGASGVPERYPGVICAREGQELVVASESPVLLTEWR